MASKVINVTPDELNQLQSTVCQTAYSGFLVGYGYTTAAAKAIQMFFPVHAFGLSSVSATGTTTLTVRGGTGTTASYNIDVSTLAWTLIQDGMIARVRYTAADAFAGGNNVAINAYFDNLTLTFS